MVQNLPGLQTHKRFRCLLPIASAEPVLSARVKELLPELARGAGFAFRWPVSSTSLVIVSSDGAGRNFCRTLGEESDKGSAKSRSVKEGPKS